MKQIKYSLTLMIFAFWLSGCGLTPPSDQITSDTQLNTADESNNGNNAFAPPPKLSPYRDWNKIFPAFVEKIIQYSDAYQGNHVILVSDVQNRSSDYISMSQIKNILRDSMMAQDVFTIIDQNAVNDAKQRLGISYDDQLVSRGKMIALAKSLEADYVLFTTIYQAPDGNNDANISMELLYTKTGEILKRVTTAQLISEQPIEMQAAPLSPLQLAPAESKPIQLIPGIDNGFSEVGQ